MTTRNAGPHISPVSQHDSEAPSDFDDNTPLRHSSLPPSRSQSTAVLEPDFGLALSTPLDPGATSTSALPPLAGPSSLKMPTPDTIKASGSKRKQEDVDRASHTEENSIERKRPKRESLDDGASLALEHMSDVADVVADSMVNQESGRPGSLDLEDEDESTHSKVDSSESATPLPDAPSSVPTVPIELPPLLTSPPRPHSAPPTSPIVVDVTTRVLPLPPPASLPPEPEPLHTYSCPICFSSPTNATLTPCGHIMCGECLFTAIGAAAVRMGIATLAARCPVCRAPIPRWDGRGGGVIGLQPRVVITI